MNKLAKSLVFLDLLCSELWTLQKHSDLDNIYQKNSCVIQYYINVSKKGMTEAHFSLLRISINYPTRKKVTTAIPSYQIHQSPTRLGVTVKKRGR